MAVDAVDGGKGTPAIGRVGEAILRGVIGVLPCGRDPEEGAIGLYPCAFWSG